MGKALDTVRDYAKKTWDTMTSAHGSGVQKLVNNKENKQPAQPQKPLYNWVDEEPSAPAPAPVVKANDASRTGLTAADMIKETGGDYDEMLKWLDARPGYDRNGPKTQAALAEAKAKKEAKASPVDTVQPSTVEEEQAEGPSEDKVEVETKAKDADDKNVEDIVGSDKEQKKQINKAAQSIWDAVARGDMDPQTGGYFLMDALMKTANNKQRRDSNYIENLSRAAHGDTILGYDVSNDEKSKYETMVQDPALERANKAAGIESTSNAQTAADLSTAQAQQQYGEAVGPEGLAQTAATKSALSGNFDTVANAFASGDETQVKAALETELKNPQIQTQLADLERQLKEGTLDADILAAKISNQLSQQQIELMKAQAKLLGFEGDLKSVLSGAIKNAGTALSSLSGGGDIMQNAGSLGMLVLLAKLGVM